MGAWLGALIALTAVSCGNGITRAKTRVPLRVEASLGTENAWRVCPWPGPWPSDQPLVQADLWEDRRILLEVTRQGRGKAMERVEIWLTLGRGAPAAEAEVIWYEEPMSMFGNPAGAARGLRGFVAVDADRLPAASDERVVTYDLTGVRDRVDVRLQGKVIITVEDLGR